MKQAKGIPDAGVPLAFEYPMRGIQKQRKR